jgi:hypothetical protein
LFHGEVINTRDVLTFQGRTLDELKTAFADTITPNGAANEARNRTAVFGGCYGADFSRTASSHRDRRRAQHVGVVPAVSMSRSRGYTSRMKPEQRAGTQALYFRQSRIGLLGAKNLSSIKQICCKFPNMDRPASDWLIQQKVGIK